MVEAKIFIPKPCHENWENMRPEEKGKFCSVCTKTVYDFTDKTKAEVIDSIKNSDGQICGRFLSSQVEVPQNYLQRKVIQLHNFSQTNFQRFTFILILVSGLMTLAGCKKEEACTTTTGLPAIPEEQANRGNDIMGKVEYREDSAQIPKKKTDNSDKSNRLDEPILQKKGDK